MRITFGMYLDSCDFSYAAASLGEIHAGPLLLCTLLEGRMGLTAPDAPSALERIYAYQPVEKVLLPCDYPVSKARA